MVFTAPKPPRLWPGIVARVLQQPFRFRLQTEATWLLAAQPCRFCQRSVKDDGPPSLSSVFLLHSPSSGYRLLRPLWSSGIWSICLSSLLSLPLKYRSAPLCRGVCFPQSRTRVIGYSETFFFFLESLGPCFRNTSCGAFVPLNIP